MHLRIFQIKSYIWSFLALVVFWIFLTGNNLSSFLLGIPAVILGIAASALLPGLTPFSIAIFRIPQFAAYFLYQSCHGGFDVAIRVLTNNLSPGILIFPFNLSNEIARVFFANAVSLLPGTLSAELIEDRVVIHVLDDRINNDRQLKKLERLVALLFREDVKYDSRI